MYSQEMDKAAKESRWKLEMFLTTFCGTVSAYFLKDFSLTKYGLNVETVIGIALCFFVLSLILSVWILGLLVRKDSIDADRASNLDAFEKAQEAFMKEKGLLYNGNIEIPHENLKDFKEEIFQEDLECLDELSRIRKRAQIIYHFRNAFILIGFAIALIGKLLGPIFVSI